jgi:hypothetical protein
VAAFYGTLFIEKEGSPVQEDKLSGTASLFLAKLFCYFYGQRHENNIDNCKSVVDRVVNIARQILNLPGY